MTIDLQFVKRIVLQSREGTVNGGWYIGCIALAVIFASLLLSVAVVGSPMSEPSTGGTPCEIDKNAGREDEGFAVVIAGRNDQSSYLSKFFCSEEDADQWLEGFLGGSTQKAGYLIETDRSNRVKRVVLVAEASQSFVSGADLIGSSGQRVVTMAGARGEPAAALLESNDSYAEMQTKQRAAYQAERGSPDSLDELSGAKSVEIARIHSEQGSRYKEFVKDAGSLDELTNVPLGEISSMHREQEKRYAAESSSECGAHKECD